MDRSPLTTMELGLKAKSKNEVYRLLVTDGGLHLPPMKESNYDYLACILSGEKGYLKNNQVKAITVPMIEGLRVKDILKFGREHIDLDKYLPVYKKNKVPDRVFLCNLVNTLLGDEFSKFVHEAMAKRERKLIHKKRMEVDALPEFKELIRKSLHVSYEKGKTNVLVSRTRKRKYNDIEDDVREEMAKKFEIEKEAYQVEIDCLKTQMKDFNILKLQNDEAYSKLEALYKDGIIDSNFDPIIDMK